MGSEEMLPQTFLNVCLPQPLRKFHLLLLMGLRSLFTSELVMQKKLEQAPSSPASCL